MKCVYTEKQNLKPEMTMKWGREITVVVRALQFQTSGLGVRVTKGGSEKP